MNKLVLVNPTFNNVFYIPDLSDGFSIIFDTDMPRWESSLQKVLGEAGINRCQLFCLFGSASNNAEDLVDDWLVSLKNEKVFFPTIADTDIEEIWYTIQSKIIILLTLEHRLIQSLARLENE